MRGGKIVSRISRRARVLYIDVLFSEKQVSRVNLVQNVFKVVRITVCDYNVRDFFEFVEVSYNATVEKTIFFHSRLVNDDFYSFRLYSFHNALNGRLTEIIAVCFHRKAVNPDDFRVLLYDLLRDEILSRRVCFDDRRNKILRNVRVIRAKLLCIFRQAISAVSE